MIWLVGRLHVLSWESDMELRLGCLAMVSQIIKSFIFVRSRFFFYILRPSLPQPAQRPQADLACISRQCVACIIILFFANPISSGFICMHTATAARMELEYLNCYHVGSWFSPHLTSYGSGVPHRCTHRPQSPYQPSTSLLPHSPSPVSQYRHLN